MLTYTISSGLQQLLRNAGKPIVNQGLLKSIAEALRKDIAYTFDQQADPVTGQKWQSWHPLTVQSRRPGKILQESGALRRSLLTSAPQYTIDSVTIASNVRYAKVHQEGMRIQGPVLIPRNVRARDAMRSGNLLAGQYIVAKNGVTIPQRRFLGFGTRSTNAVVFAISDYYAGVFK
jgi:phage virion morphogenesis protein